MENKYEKVYITNMQRVLLLFLASCLITQVAVAQYCTPAANCSDDDYINNFTFYSISNLNSGGSNCFTNSYIYTGLSATVYKGLKYGLTIQSGPAWDEGFGIWIDYNQDGDFDDASEFVYASPYSSTSAFSDSIVISNSALTGTTRMRVRCSYGAVLFSSQSCDTLGYGETEDYLLIIQDNTAPPVANFTSNVTMSCNGNVNFTDQTQNAPYSWQWNFGDGGTDTVQHPTHTYTVNGNYTVTLITSNSYGSDTLVKTNYIIVDIGGGPKAPSCTSPTGNGTLGFGITYFSFGNISNYSGNSSEGYQDYTCLQSTNLTEGKIYNMAITVDKPTTHHVRVWIDYNNDAAFDTTNELFVSVNSTLTVSENKFIPTGKILNTPLRMRLSADWSGSPEPKPCATLQYGQAEDYTVIILPNTEPPLASFTVDDSITCNNNVSFTDISQNVPTSWYWNFGDGSTDTIQNPSHSYAKDSNYTITFIASNQFGSDTLIKNNFIQVKTDSIPGNAACTPATLGYCCGYGIYNVTFNQINNSTNDGIEGYQDFTCQHRSNLIENKSYTLSIQTSSSSSQDTKAWIDYDNDGVFNDSTELILTANNQYNPSKSILIPSNAIRNTALRMRITSDYAGSNPLSCSDLDYGQAEDYTVVIRENTLPPEVYFKADKTLSCDGVINFTDSIINVADNILWDFGNGKTDTINNPSHTYDNNGVYDVTLIVTNKYGSDTVIKTGYIAVSKYFCDTILIPSSGLDTVSTCGGKLFDPGGAIANYPDYSDGYRVIISPGADSLTITFQYFALSSSDYLYMYDGPSTASPLIGIYTGTSLPNGGTINSSGNALTFRFYSNGWTNNLGFEATLVPNYSGSAIPTAGLTASDTNPPFGSTVKFSDNSTGNISSWYWDFGDGNTSSLINPDHQFFISDTFNVMLVVSNCIGEADTASQQIIVQGAPNIEYNPESFNVTLFTEDSTTLPLTIHNTGDGSLNYSLSTTIIKGGSSKNNFEFYDGFEDGTYSKWQNAGGSYTREVTSVNPAIDNYSFKLTGGNMGIFDGIYAAFNPDTHNYAGFYVKSSSTSNIDAVVVGGDDNTTSNNGIFFFYANDDGTFYMSNSNVTVNYNANQWYHIECKNIDYSSQTFDYYVDEVLIEADVYFNTYSTYLSQIHFFNYYSNSVGYLDEMVIGNDNSKIISAEWISYNPEFSLDMPVNNIDTVNVKFNAKGLYGGQYIADLNITSNDPDSSLIIVPCTLNVIGIPVIDISSSSIDFGNVYIGATAYDTLTISNIGTDSLFISNILITDTVFKTNLSSFKLYPGTSQDVIISFLPTAAIAYNANLTLFNNDNDTIISLSGSGIEPPVISVSPNSFYVTLQSGDSTNRTLTINNSGNSNLNYNIIFNGGQGGNLDNILQELDNNYSNITSQIPNRYDFFDGDTGSYISDGGDDMYDDGNMLGTNLGSPIYYSDGVVKNESLLGTNGSYFTRKYIGLFVFAADIDNVNYFEITGNLGADGMGNYDITTIKLTVGGINYTGFVKRVYGADDPSVNHLIIIEDNASVAHNYSSDTDNDFDQLINLSNSKRIYYLLYASSLGNYIDNAATQNIMSTFLQSIGTTAMWASATPVNGTITTSSSNNINVKFNAKGLLEGVYASELTIISNDPLKPQVIVPCTLDVYAPPIADFDFNVDMNCNGQVSFSDLSLNTVTSRIWYFGDGQTSNLKYPVHTYTASGTYIAKLVVCNSYGCDSMSRYVIVQVGDIPIAMCTPQTNYYNWNEGIYRVQLSEIDKSSNGATDGYEDFTCGNLAFLMVNQTYTLTITTGDNYEEDVMVWIDFNNDGNLTSSEIILNDSKFQNHSIDFVVNSSFTVYNTPLRMRVISTIYWNTIYSSCASIDEGQAEDYTVIVLPETIPPSANFKVNYLDVCQGMVHFIDSSKYNPTSWLWNFGDGSGTSTKQSPYYTYTTPGSYNVTLTATNQYGSDVVSKAVYINSVVADFNVSTWAEINTPVAFTNQSSGASSYFWDFGDGYSSLLTSPNHIYTDVGSYKITLNASSTICSDQKSKYINIVMTGDDDISSDEFLTIYPNPTNGKINLTYKFNSNKNLRISISNILGEQLILEEINASEIFVKEFNLSGFSSGIYNILISDGNKSISKKVIVE